MIPVGGSTPRQLLLWDRTHIAVAMLVRTQRHRVLAWSGALLTLWELYQAFREQWPRRDQPTEP